MFGELAGELAEKFKSPYAQSGRVVAPFHEQHKRQPALNRLGNGWIFF